MGLLLEPLSGRGGQRPFFIAIASTTKRISPNPERIRAVFFTQRGKEPNVANNDRRNERMKPVVVMAALALVGFAMPGKSDAAVFADSTDINQARANALPFVASNGGPTVIIEAREQDGTLIGFASGTIITNLDGTNATVFTAAHVIANLSKGYSDCQFFVVTGTNAFTDRGQVILPSEIIWAPGADGTSDKLDLAALILPCEILNAGQFVVASPPTQYQQLTAIGAGVVLTQSQGRDGTFEPQNGGYNKYDGEYYPWAAYGNDTFLDASEFERGQFPFGGVSANGDSGGTILDPFSFQWDEDGQLIYAEIVGITVGFAGDRLGLFSQTVYTDLTNPNGDAYQFVMEMLSRSGPSTTVPEPSTLGIGVLGAAGLLLKRRRVVLSRTKMVTS